MLINLSSSRHDEGGGQVFSRIAKIRYSAALALSVHFNFLRLAY